MKLFWDAFGVHGMKFFSLFTMGSRDPDYEVPRTEEELHNIRVLTGTIGLAILLPLLYWGISAGVNALTSLRNNNVEKPPASALLPPPTISLTWFGEITDARADEIVVHDIVSPNGISKKAIITADTAITLLTFVPVVTNGGKQFNPQEKHIGPSDLKQGMRVDIVATEDVSHADSFHALQIRVLP